MELEALLEILGIGFRELIQHRKSGEWTATALPKEVQLEKRKVWKNKVVMAEGKTPKEALEKLIQKIKI
jgi:hypothetical protein